MLDTVPAPRRDAAARALADAFGRRAISPLTPVTGGASGALAFHFECGARPYLLRLESAERNGLRDPARAYACMKIAAEAGVAPPLTHADPTIGAVIMDFIGTRPLAEIPGGPAGLVRAIGELIVQLQGAPVFPPLTDFVGLLTGGLTMLETGPYFAPGLLAPHREVFERIREAYRLEEPLVSSHNDLNPQNLLYDGARLWLVDWELSFACDPLADLATAANTFAATPDLRALLLRTWAGGEPDARLDARLTLVQQLSRLYYGLIATTSAVSTGRRAPPDDSLAAPLPWEIGALAAKGELPPAMPDILHLLGKACLRAFVEGAATPEFEAALARARNG